MVPFACGHCRALEEIVAAALLVAEDEVDIIDEDVALETAEVDAAAELLLLNAEEDAVDVFVEAANDDEDVVVDFVLDAVDELICDALEEAVEAGDVVGICDDVLDCIPADEDAMDEESDALVEVPLDVLAKDTGPATRTPALVCGSETNIPVIDFG